MTSSRRLVFVQQDVGYDLSRFHKSPLSLPYLSLFSIPHPKTQQDMLIALGRDGHCFEMQQHATSSCCIIDSILLGNTNCILLTPWDIKWTILSYLYTHPKKTFISVQEILKEFPHHEKIVNAVVKLENIGDVQDNERILSWNFNKVLKWLNIKCSRVTLVLKTKAVEQNTAFSSTFVAPSQSIKVKNSEIENDRVMKQRSMQIVGEYLPLELYAEWCKAEGVMMTTLQELKTTSTSALDGNNDENADRFDHRRVAPPPTKRKGPTTSTTKIKKVNKVPGMASMHSFFQRK